MYKEIFGPCRNRSGVPGERYYIDCVVDAAWAVGGAAAGGLYSACGLVAGPVCSGHLGSVGGNSAGRDLRG